MNVYSYVGIIEGVAKLIIVFVISYTSIDKLLIYALLLACVTTVTQGFYMFYSLRRYKECYFRFVYDKKLLKETRSLVGWNFVGTAVYAVNDSGVNILLNMLTTVETARVHLSSVSLAPPIRL